VEAERPSPGYRLLASPNLIGVFRGQGQA
jgi:hypothetical protein